MAWNELMSNDDEGMRSDYTYVETENLSVAIILSRFPNGSPCMLIGTSYFSAHACYDVKLLVITFHLLWLQKLLCEFSFNKWTLSFSAHKKYVSKNMDEKSFMMTTEIW